MRMFEGTYIDQYARPRDCDKGHARMRAHTHTQTTYMCTYTLTMCSCTRPSNLTAAIVALMEIASTVAKYCTSLISCPALKEIQK